MIKVHYFNSSQVEIAKQWNQFIHNHPSSHCYHLVEWKSIIDQAFRLKGYYLYATKNSGEICGICPLILSKSLLFGTYITSIPFFNYSGILATDPNVEIVLLQEAEKIARQLKASYIEFRHRQALNLDLPTRSHKVRMILKLPVKDPEILWKGFKAKLRSQIKRAQRESMTVKFGGIELVPSFYEVFSANMRDLGTPVWTMEIFRQIASRFSDGSTVCIVELDGRPIAAAFLIGYKDLIEIPSASSLREFNRLSPNMLLYWSVLEYACLQGYRYFDFGRSSPGTGTYKFKEQWGADPEPLHWQYWLNKGHSLPNLNPNNPKYTLMIKTWQKLPLRLSRTIGPLISRHLP